MRSRLALNVQAFYTEHSYVQSSFLKVTDNNKVIWQDLNKWATENDIAAYMNHIVVEYVCGGM